MSVHERDADDPRPVLVEDGADWFVLGYRCEECGYRLAATRPRCPVCRGALAVRRYGPDGVVWSSTVLRAGVPDREPPFALAYVDLDDGPRVLCHVTGSDEPEVLTPGTVVVLAGLTDDADPTVTIKGVER